MTYFTNLLNLFQLLFSKAVSFVNIIALFMVSGLFGGLVTLLKMFINPSRFKDE